MFSPQGGGREGCVSGLKLGVDVLSTGWWKGGVCIRLKVGIQPLKIILPGEGWNSWCMQVVYASVGVVS